MGLLDDLRKQSDELKAKEDQESVRKAEVGKVYAEQIQPKMVEIYNHLKELTDHLNYIKLDTKATYIINAEGMEVELVQGEYNVSIDSTDNTGLVALRFTCSRPDPIEFMVRDANVIPKHVGYLNQYNLQFEGRKQTNDRGDVVGAHFKLKPQIQCEILFSGDRETACVNLVIANFDVLGRSTHNLTAEQLTDQFVDDFDRFLIRENMEMFAVKVDDKVKEELRAKIQEEQRRRTEELEEAERKEKEEIEARKQARKEKGLALLKKVQNSIPTEKIMNKFNKSGS